MRISEDREQLLAELPGSDAYYFDPDTVTLHMLEVLTAARSGGFVYYDPPVSASKCRAPFVVRITYSNEDVRVQIGSSRWYRNTNPNTAIAMRHAFVDAMVDYYDQAIAPYQS